MIRLDGRGGRAGQHLSRLEREHALVPGADDHAFRGIHGALGQAGARVGAAVRDRDRKSTRLNSSHGYISYAVFCLKKKKTYAPSTSPSAGTEATTNPHPR